MTDAPLATDPAASFSVLASAGTGKTWQLVARLTRLLLAGATPDSILAITFTRKAAGEMQQRLGERLACLLEADDANLRAMLREIGEHPDDAVCARARALLENWLRSEHSLRTTTFHSFCQELLQRFPLEAGLPPGFELTESAELLIDEAWDALFAEATRAPDSEVARALEQLFSTLGSRGSTEAALRRFVEHRSDWWAMTRNHADPVREARERLAEKLDLDAQAGVREAFWNARTRERLTEFSRLLGRHPNSSNLKFVAQLEPCLTETLDAAAAIDCVKPVFLKNDGTPRQRKPNATLEKKLGAEGSARFLELHELLCNQLLAVLEADKRQRCHAINSAWYIAGARMLDHFQRIKRERRLLDFADLEWKTFLLLNDPEHAHWVQYKLDQRIDHLLIDEFQDTNPTQWQMILPLLEEMAAGGERWRSLFLVGDRKQSIYRFRRGNPALLERAAGWMSSALGARQVRLDRSRRSSPVIMEAVNRIFTSEAMQPLMPDFPTHGTHLEDAWGQVEIWPLVEAGEATPEPGATALRDPLQTPRSDPRDERHYREGRLIAGRIRELVEQGVAGYGDILVLMRSRTHLADYERALRERGIPYLARDRGTLLQSLEIRDMEALLTVLMTPQDNLALAQVLRSPLFSLDDGVLVQLSRPAGGVWLERLMRLAAEPQAPATLQRAAQLLDHWRTLAGRIPIHDLLERIFHQSNLPARYRAAVAESAAPQVEANLARFVELALEVDSGRYPTLPRFLERVKRLRALDKEGLSKATPEAAQQDRVNLLTIHASKGLEAPVVFLCDTTSMGRDSGIKCLVRWPADSDRPTDFLLPGSKAERDSVSAASCALEDAEDARESANLLYVALTRARNMLIVSGCRPTRGSALGWYQQIAEPLCGGTDLDDAWIQRHGEPPTPEAPQPSSATATQTAIDPRLRHPIPVARRVREIAPSRLANNGPTDAGDAQGRQRGLLVHRLLQLAVEQGGLDATAVERVAREQGLASDDPLLHACREEVAALFRQPDLGWVLENTPAHYSEVPLQYRRDEQMVYGIVDRLVVEKQAVHVIDYKSHQVEAPERLDVLAHHYRPQLELYREGVARLWPEKTVRRHLLFTHCARLYPLD